jgi:hypothetical protein
VQCAFVPDSTFRRMGNLIVGKIGFCFWLPNAFLALSNKLAHDDFHARWKTAVELVLVWSMKIQS